MGVAYDTRRRFLKRTRSEVVVGASGLASGEGEGARGRKKKVPCRLTGSEGGHISKLVEPASRLLDRFAIVSSSTVQGHSSGVMIN